MPATWCEAAVPGHLPQQSAAATRGSGGFIWTLWPKRLGGAQASLGGMPLPLARHCLPAFGPQGSPTPNSAVCVDTLRASRTEGAAFGGH